MRDLTKIAVINTVKQ